MKETPLSNCEKEFILKAISERKRLDGREIYDYRRIRITFGVDRGCCEVTLGNTRVLAQVACEVTAPKQTRPSEGILYVNVELSPMASPQFEAGRQSEEAVELNRLLERCLKESRCVDTESLCIKAGIKVWQVRCDIHVLNQDGNMLDCAGVAAIAALAHFRRPDVTVSGEDITIHSLEDRDPIPLSVHHMPLCVTFAFFHQGKFLLVDPILSEEKVMEGKLIVGMNKHREVCTLQMTGSMLLLKDQVLRCSNIAVSKVTEMTELIHQALMNDTKARTAGQKFGFATSIDTQQVTANKKDPCSLNMEGIEEAASSVVEASKELSDTDSDSEKPSRVQILGAGTGTIGEGGKSTWDIDEEGQEDMVEELLEEEKLKTQQPPSPLPQETAGHLSGDSEEEEVVMLEDKTFEKKKAQPVSSKSIDLSKALKSDKKKKKKKS